jgi:hypothetical protein
MQQTSGGHGVKAKVDLRGSAAAARPKAKRTPRVAAVKRVDPARPQRVWSLLLPPTFWTEGK